MLINQREPPPAVERIVALDLKIMNSPVRLLRPVAPIDPGALDPVLGQKAGPHHTVEDLDPQALAFLFQRRFEGASPDAYDNVVPLFRRVKIRFSHSGIRQIAVDRAVAGGNHELGFVIPAFGAGIFIIGVPDLAAHLLHFKQRVEVLAALDLDPDTVGVRAAGHVARPVIRVYSGQGICRGITPVIASRTSGAAPDGVALFHQSHTQPLPGGADCRPASGDPPSDHQDIRVDLPVPGQTGWDRANSVADLLPSNNHAM